MKKISLKAAFVAMIIALAAFSQSCNGGSDKKETPQAPASVSSTLPDGLPNYRYVNLDTILSKYNLAKDYQEELLRMQGNYYNQAKKHDNKLRSLENNINNKIQNNIYMTQASMDADREEYAKLQYSAQNELMGLQREIARMDSVTQVTLSDSIRNFIKTYNQKKNYDAIFIENATMYINPALDITSEIVEGLNARYNKVK